MVWVKLDDKFHGHRKTLALFDGPCPGDSIALWTLANSWCGDQLTNGHVPLAFVRRSGLDKRAPDELVRVELWHRTEDGYVFHDWLARNKSREAVEKERADALERKANGKRRSPDVPPNGREKFGRTSSEPPAGVRETFSFPDPTRPDPTDLGSGSADLNGHHGVNGSLPPPPNGLGSGSATEADAHEVSRTWHAFMEQAVPGNMHGFGQWRGDFETVAIALHQSADGVPEHVRIARVALCAWFWVAESGPVQSGRIGRSRATPQHLAKHISRDIEAAQAWWAALEAAEQDALLEPRQNPTVREATL